jgi:ribosomal-protein-alanine N-acetyltransferase
MQLTTTRLHLREVHPSDVPAIHALNSIPEVDEYNTLGLPESVGVTQALVDEILAAQTTEPRVRYVLVIEDKDTHAFMGLTGLVMGKPKYFSAELWYKLLPKHWNKGYTTEAVQALLQFGFGPLQLHRIEAGCATGNTASYKVLEKCGFIREAHTRKLLPIRCNWVDNYGYAILEEDYFKIPSR